MTQPAVSGKVRTLVVVEFSPDFDVEAFIWRLICDHGKGMTFFCRKYFEGGNETIARLLGPRSGGSGHALFLEGDTLLGEKPEGPGVLACYVTQSVPDANIALIFPDLAPDYN